MTESNEKLRRPQPGATASTLPLGPSKTLTMEALWSFPDSTERGEALPSPSALPSSRELLPLLSPSGSIEPSHGSRAASAPRPISCMRIRAASLVLLPSGKRAFIICRRWCRGSTTSAALASFARLCVASASKGRNRAHTRMEKRISSRFRSSSPSQAPSSASSSSPSSAAAAAAEVAGPGLHMPRIRHMSKNTARQSSTALAGPGRYSLASLASRPARCIQWEGPHSLACHCLLSCLSAARSSHPQCSTRLETSHAGGLLRSGSGVQPLPCCGGAAMLPVNLTVRSRDRVSTPSGVPLLCP
mmetsp:Transcript_10332/g.29471  ORF Transcript_10332/g.29471 Transcript_10332/m.29471 type:complete len:302 (+) Transcript_10332:1231-2136(+)